MIKTKKILAMLIVVMLIISNLFTISYADPPIYPNVDRERTTGSLTITKLENGRTDEDGNKLPLEGVKFKIYRVDDDAESLDVPEKYLQEEYDSSSDENYYTNEATTGTDGQVEFIDLKLGRYLVIEAEAPINVVYKSANFLVDIPTTSVMGNDLIYDVEVTPKNDTVYGGIVLTKVNEKGEPMQGVKFILQTTSYKLVVDGTDLGLMENIIPTKEREAPWITVTELKGEERIPKELITDENGQITLQGLPEGDYRFIETETLDGYILDNQTSYYFYVELEDDGTTGVYPESIEVVNTKPTLEKTITGITRNENNTNTNTSLGIAHKIKADKPSNISEMETFSVTDTLDEGLIFVENNFNLDLVVSKELIQENMPEYIDSNVILRLKRENQTLDLFMIADGQIIQHNSEVVRNENLERLIKVTSENNLIKLEFTKEAIEIFAPDIESGEFTYYSKNPDEIKSANSADIGDTISYSVYTDIPSVEENRGTPVSLSETDEEGIMPMLRRPDTVIERMKTFKLSDTLDNGLTLGNNFEIIFYSKYWRKSAGGSDESQDTNNISAVEIEPNGYTYDITEAIESGDIIFNHDEHSWSLEFSEDFKYQLSNYYAMEVRYSAVLNENAIATEAGNANKAKLEYSTIVDTDYNDNPNEDIIKVIEDSEIAYTGGFSIEKRASRANGELLSGAVFKLADSEENAKKGKYITNYKGNEITLTTEDGVASYKGLSYGKYYLVEVKAPSYVENGETKHYNLLKGPIEISVGENTYEGPAVVVINKKGTLLPMTGGMGTLLITLVGIVLVTIGVVYIRKNKEEVKIKKENK